MTDDPTVAMTWYQQLPEQGIEGIVAKRATSVYKAGRIWKKIRHAETVEADVVGYTVAAARPRALAVRLPDGRIALTQSLKAPLAAQVAVHFAASGPLRSARTPAGEIYTTAAPGLVVEVLAPDDPARRSYGHPAAPRMNRASTKPSCRRPPPRRPRRPTGWGSGTRRYAA